MIATGEHPNPQLHDSIVCPTFNRPLENFKMGKPPSVHPGLNREARLSQMKVHARTALIASFWQSQLVMGSPTTPSILPP